MLWGYFTAIIFSSRIGNTHCAIGEASIITTVFFIWIVDAVNERKFEFKFLVFDLRKIGSIRKLRKMLSNILDSLLLLHLRLRSLFINSQRNNGLILLIIRTMTLFI